MLKSVSEYLRAKTASKIITARQLPDVGIDLDEDADPVCAKEVCNCIAHQPVKLIRDCCIKTLGFEDLGPTAKYYPNHGYYRPSDEVLNLNTRMLEDPVFGTSVDGRPISKFEFILAHELGHGWDAAQGQNRVGKDYSLCPEWLELSDWSEVPKPGHRRLRIRERGYPEKVGEWYYGPQASFPRYYGKMNPWDDWADGFAYYITGMKDKLPEEKFNYFNKRLASYFEEPLHPIPFSQQMDEYVPVFAFRNNDPKIQDLLKKYPEFMSAAVRYFPMKEMFRRQKYYGIDIPDLHTYMRGTKGMREEEIPFEKDTDTLKKYLGRVPLKEEGIDKAVEDFLKKHGPKEEMKPELTKGKVPVFEPGVPGGSMIKIATALRDIANKLDDKGMLMQAAELRSASKRLAADAEETFSIAGSPVRIKSLEEFFEETKEYPEFGKDFFKNFLDLYEKEYLDKLIPEVQKYVDSPSKKNKIGQKIKNIKGIYTLAVRTNKAQEEIDKPVPGKVFEDPQKPKPEKIKKLINAVDSSAKPFILRELKFLSENIDKY